MIELITLKFALVCSPLILILLIQLVFLAYLAKCKKEINRLPEDSEEAEEEIKDKIFKFLKIYTIAVSILLAFAMVISLTL
jgi:hypothetical protein